MANVIYRGHVEREPSTVNLPVGAALLPGTLVVLAAGALVAATAAEQDFHVLGNMRFAGQDVETAYAVDDTGVAYETRRNDVFQCRLAAATYAVGDELTINATGQLVAAAATELVVARFAGTAGAKTAGQLDDVKMSSLYPKA